MCPRSRQLPPVNSSTRPPWSVELLGIMLLSSPCCCMLQMNCFPSVQLDVEGWSPCSQSRHAVHGPSNSLRAPSTTSCSASLCWANFKLRLILELLLVIVELFTAQDCLSLMAASRPSSSSILLSSAPLPRNTDNDFRNDKTTLEPTGMRWQNDQVHTRSQKGNTTRLS